MLGIAYESLHTITMNLPLTLAIHPYDHARDLRPQGIDLNVLDWNPARGFYERIGFKWIRNWLPYRLSGEALEKLAQG